MEFFPVLLRPQRGENEPLRVRMGLRAHECGVAFVRGYLSSGSRGTERQLQLEVEGWTAALGTWLRHLGGTTT